MVSNLVRVPKLLVGEKYLSSDKEDNPNLGIVFFTLLLKKTFYGKKLDYYQK